MPRVESAGLQLFRRDNDGALEVLLAHLGGPFWTRRHEGAWTVIKGEVEPGEDLVAAASREFSEETGLPVPTGPWLSLGEVRQSRKNVHLWAIEADLDPAALRPGTFELEWPPRSGQLQSFPEIDRVQWFSLVEGAKVIVASQRPFLDRLPQVVDGGTIAP